MSFHGTCPSYSNTITKYINLRLLRTQQEGDGEGQANTYAPYFPIQSAYTGWMGATGGGSGDGGGGGGGGGGRGWSG